MDFNYLQNWLLLREKKNSVDGRNSGERELEASGLQQCLCNTKKDPVSLRVQPSATHTHSLSWFYTHTL